MTTSHGFAPVLDTYQLRLPVFEGPLDVLLRLIEREQLPISDVSLLAVLDQFLAFMETIDTPSSPEIVAEFATVAGRLALLKSRALLPRPPEPGTDQDEPDLVRQLEEYRAVKAAAALLAGRQKAGVGAFGRGDGIVLPAETPARLAPQPALTLANAVGRWLTRIPPAPRVVIPRHIVSLREMISRILAVLEPGERVSFDRIRASCAGRQEIGVAFLALLTLLRRRALVATQTDLFGPITVTRADADASPTPGDPAWELARGGSHEHR
jgi:segregation and condensation protein A